MEIVFWTAISLIVYSYFIYPLLLIIMSNVKQVVTNNSTVNQTPIENSKLPNVTVIIAAFNEDSCIKARVENLLSLDYPQDKLTIRIGSDGSSDNTAQILESITAENFHAHIFEKNRGKMSVLNDLVESATDEILVMSDANTHFNPDAINELVKHFQNDSVGVVCGELNLVDAESGINQDSIYWRYEQVLKFHEAQLGALLGANGAIYAIRKSLYVPLPANTIVDDFQVVMNVSKQKFKTIYDPSAIAIEEVAPNLAEEEGRRIRIGLGNYQAFFKMRWALNPLLGWRFIAYLSHKVCRWFVPHFMVIAFISNIVLLSEPFYQLSMLGQIAFYWVAYWGIKKQKQDIAINTLASLIAFFVSMNVALMRGFIRYFNSNVQGSWQRTSR
ncbi:glycosyltransferase family 2 protein [Colwellia sp. 20A7]|uniref:glycosyltransferase family 2 protein n=1 Tax=Colwellia sp. 20A7 TaxID=2689569 RepID=UPI0013569328|nr:glycosyltransferase family 2 protein [Colwellia sp. 20A7]